jgi:hypothetical protein
MLATGMKLGTSLVFNVAAACAGTALVALIGAEGTHHRVRDLSATLVVFGVVVIVMNNHEYLVLALQRSGRWRRARRPLGDHG